MGDDGALVAFLLGCRDGCLVVFVPDVFHVFSSGYSLLSQVLVEICCILGLVHDIGRRTRLRSVDIWSTSDLLPRSRDIPIRLLPRVFDFDSVDRIPWSLGVRMIRSVHRRVGVDDVLMLAESDRVDRIVVGFKSYSGLPCFRSPGALVACHVFLRKPLLDCFCFPVIVPNAPATFDHPSTKLTEH